MPLRRREFIKLGSLTTAHLALFRPKLFPAPGERATSTPDLNDLRRDFVTVPDAAKPGCYWWWLDGQINHAGVTRDLEEFRAKGMGGVLLVNSTNFGHDRPSDGVKFLSTEWRELYRHMIREAHRLGIEVGVNLCGGWAMGGPWIKPKDSGRWFLQSRLSVIGPRKFSESLPLPGHRDGYDKVFNPPGWKQYIDLPLEVLDYRDTSIVAFPDPHDEGTRLTDARAELLSAKTNRKDASNFARARDVMGPTLVPWEPSPSDRPIPPEQVVDLMPKLTPDGRLEWDVPPGRWTIVRTGHRMTGSRLMIAPPEADGLSVDWLASRPVDVQFEHLGRIFLEEAQPHVGTTLKYFCDDSFEDGFPNWTHDILDQFEAYRGYDPRPYLPVLNGFIIGSAEVSDRFLHDYRKTVADCMADGHYRYFAELCHRHGLEVQNESAGPSRSGTMCMDGLKNLGRSDRPMGEFWLGLRHDEPGGLDPKLSYGVSRLEDGQNKVTKMVSSAAHIYGRRTASAEAFTSNRHWLDFPGNLKQASDRAFCEGINRFVIHTSTASRPEDGKPGYEYYAGTHFNPNVTWWNQAGPFIAYLGRCQHLLQQGLFVADVLYYNGDGAPNLVAPKHTDPSLGFGYDYDVCNAEVLLTRLAVRDGRIVLPDGMSYRLLVLPDHPRMPSEVVAKVRDLVAAGATVVGRPPERDPGLRNYPECDANVRSIAAQVWGQCDGHDTTTHSFGRGRVCWGRSLRDILTADGVRPDFAHSGGDAIHLDFIHRTTPDAEIYFVANLSREAATLDCTFRVTGRTPEIWDPVTATQRTATAFRHEGDHTTLPLELAPFQSFFIVFPRRDGATATTTRAARAGSNFPRLAPRQELTGPWQVAFDPVWGGPAAVEFATLEDWTTRPEPGIRYYSGTATYRKTFDLAPAPTTSGQRIFLDLGKVHAIAEVRLNGQPLGIVWTAPWRIELTDTVRSTGNVLEIDVVNLWPNRLIHDAGLPPEQRLTRTNIPFKPDAPLLPSGLLGPVVLQTSPR